MTKYSKIIEQLDAMHSKLVETIHANDVAVDANVEGKSHAAQCCMHRIYISAYNEALKVEKAISSLTSVGLN